MAVKALQSSISYATKCFADETDRRFIMEKILKSCAHADEEIKENALICLRDIGELFMDTGIGRSSYSIMEQGKIDMLLSARPEDRRQVFHQLVRAEVARVATDEELVEAIAVCKIKCIDASIRTCHALRQEVGSEMVEFLTMDRRT